MKTIISLAVMATVSRWAKSLIFSPDNFRDNWKTFILRILFAGLLVADDSRQKGLQVHRAAGTAGDDRLQPETSNGFRRPYQRYSDAANWRQRRGS